MGERHRFGENTSLLTQTEANVELTSLILHLFLMKIINMRMRFGFVVVCVLFACTSRKWTEGGARSSKTGVRMVMACHVGPVNRSWVLYKGSWYS